jgi:hypothetical protein
MMSITNCLLAVAAATAVLSHSSFAWAQAGPDLIIAKSHTGDFMVGANGIYTIVVSNVGDTASSPPNLDPIQIVDAWGNIGFAFVSGTGTGWSCFPVPQPGGVVCRYSGVVPAGGSAPQFTLTVMPRVSGTVTNTVTVEGGGDTILTNNSSSDVTVVLAGVPTLPEWALIALTVLLLLAGVAAMRQRMTQAARPVPERGAENRNTTLH